MAVVTTENVAARIEKFALEQLNGVSAVLVEPQVTVRLLPDTRAPAPCSVTPVLAALDLRQRSRMRFSLSCPEPGGWRREFVVRGTITAQVLVTTRPLPAGQVIAADDVALVRRDISAIDDSQAAPADVLGKTSRRALRAGELLRATQLQSVPLVRRGQAVQIVARGAQVEASMAGEALDNGARGALVRVRNASSGNVIQARVVDTGVVAPLGQAGAN